MIESYGWYNTNFNLLAFVVLIIVSFSTRLDQVDRVSKPVPTKADSREVMTGMEWDCKSDIWSVGVMVVSPMSPFARLA